MDKTKEMTINRTRKGRLFKKLFDGEENRENLLDLYNAVNGTAYTDAGELEITTLEDVIYMGMKNDLSFIIDHNTMNHYEHQSSFCLNMPLRGLIYASMLYQKYIKTKDQYLPHKTAANTHTPIPGEAVRNRVMAEKDVAVLKRWFKLVARIDNLEGFESAMG